MKKYSSKQAKKGRTAYRTPSRFIYQKHQQVAQWKSKKK